MSRKINDLRGQVFGRLTVVDFSEFTASGARWICRCSCGNEKIVSRQALKSGMTKSCGCLRKEVSSTRMAKHGAATRQGKSREYKIWSGMNSRCATPSATGFDRYGGDGVAVCDRWKSFENFYADMGPAPSGYSIDRIDSSKGYEPGNCRWASRQTQNENRKSVRWIEFDGKRMNIAQWARHLGVSKATLYEALEKHPVEIALRSRTT